MEADASVEKIQFLEAENEDGDQGEKDGNEIEATASSSREPRVSRKRTKTGCQTCRRRRIKCGEEKPTCGNCLKSKRQCEGYNQRVIFKEPLSTWRGAVVSTAAHATLPPERAAGSAAMSSNEQSQVSLQIIAPKRITPEEVIDPECTKEPKEFEPITAKAGYHNHDITADRQLLDESHISSSDPPRGTNMFDAKAVEILEIQQVMNHQDGMHGMLQLGSESEYDLAPHGSDSATSSSVTRRDLRQSQRHPQESSRSALSTHTRTAWSQIRTSSPTPRQSDWTGPDRKMYPSQHATSDTKHAPYPRDSISVEIDHPRFDHRERSHSTRNEDVQDQPLRAQIPVEPVPISSQRTLMRQFDEFVVNQTKYDFIPLQTPPPTYPHNDFTSDYRYRYTDTAASYCLDESDEEMNYEEYDLDAEAGYGETQHSHLQNNDLGIVVALQSKQDSQDQRLRTYHSVIENYGPDMLTHYHPSVNSSPLRDSTTARIFCHFINVTGPAISMYERHPANPSLMFQGRPISKSQQHIWAYTFPTLALGNQALLHAMLALSSLQIARLQPNTSLIPSLKHYHIALRRVAKSVSLPTRRGQPATLAASLLLGYYEVWSAEHQKWSNHLLGSTHLIREIDFKGMTSFIKRQKLAQRTCRDNEDGLNESTVISDLPYHRQRVVHLLNDDVDENLVGMIMGKQLRYDQYGEIVDENNAPLSQDKVYTHRDLDIYENQRDLFWWYCKQDAYQSILSGNRLFLDYEFWSHCPPRAPLGRRDAIYGTFDHMTLLLGRVAEFAAKDLKRKRQVMNANGGRWRPSPEMQMPRSSSHAEHSISAASPLRPQSESGPTLMPNFAGMIPGTEGKATLPRGFTPRMEMSPESSDDDDETQLERLTHEAEEEWHEINAALKLLEDNFGPDFQALGSEHSQPIQSPFGPALQYRTYSIAGIWITFYLALIVLHRAHPSMPPATMVAMGLAARQTSSYARVIGRIVAGIPPDLSYLTEVNTQVGSGLTEATFGLFVAAVQYQDPAQRDWIIEKLFDIKRLTGWETAIAVASGCETSWKKAAEMGRGPPYARFAEKERIPTSVWYSGSRRVGMALSNRHVDNQKLVVTKQEKVHYVLGLLGVEEDLQQLELDE